MLELIVQQTITVAIVGSFTAWVWWKAPKDSRTVATDYDRELEERIDRSNWK